MTDGVSFISPLSVHGCVCVSEALEVESTLGMCYNDRLSATTAAGICRMSLSTYTEGETRTGQTNNRITAVTERTGFEEKERIKIE